MGRGVRRWLRPTGLGITALALTLALPLIIVVAAARLPFGREEAAPRPLPAPEVRGTLASLPVEAWSGRIALLQAEHGWRALDRELQEVQARHRDLYDRYWLGYLHARVRLEAGNLAEAGAGLVPFLALGHPLRDLALHYHARIAGERGERLEAAWAREEWDVLVAGRLLRLVRDRLNEEWTIDGEID